jgi:putative peptide zinc metalloprotease protein
VRHRISTRLSSAFSKFMYKHNQTRFRPDLVIAPSQTTSADEIKILIKDPITGDLFEFTEEEYFLCEKMNGQNSPEQILQYFRDKFGESLKAKELHQFSKSLKSSNLLEEISDQPTSNTRTDKPPIPQSQNFSKPKVSLSRSQKNKKKSKNQDYLWTLPAPALFFRIISTPVYLFKILLFPLTWLTLIITPIIAFTLISNLHLVLKDSSFYFKNISYLSHTLFNLFLSSLIVKITQGAIFTAYGGKVKKFGLILAFGFFPRFYIDRTGMYKLHRSQSLLVLATPLLMRLFFLCLSIFLWHSVRGSSSSLTLWALLMIHVNLIDFFLDANPFWPADGYILMLSYFKLPELYQRSYLLWDFIVHKRPFPETLSAKTQRNLKLFSIFSLLSSAIFLVLILLIASFGLGENFISKILGNASEMVVFCIFLVLIAHKLWTQRSKMKNKTHQDKKQKDALPEILIFSESNSIQYKPKNTKRFNWTWGKSLNLSLQILILAGTGFVLMLPYQFRPGGSFKLLPPQQQNIQAQVSGKVVTVLNKGGTNAWIKPGTPLAILESNDLKSNVLESEFQIEQQKAAIREAKANVAKLLAIPKKEDVDVAKRQVEVAKSQTEATKKRIDTDLAQAVLSAEKLKRYEALYKEGAFSRQDYEDQKRQTDTDQTQVETDKQDYDASKKKLAEVEANLALVKSGAYPQDIQAAREAVSAAQAELARRRQQTSYLKDQVHRTTLTMPFYGRLLTSHLEQKVGTYLKQGDTFAIAADNRDLLGEMEVPEAVVDKLFSNRKVEVKLWARQGKSFSGKIIEIEPAANPNTETSQTLISSSTGDQEQTLQESAGKIVRVLVKVNDPKGFAKPGMTGYAKIDGETMPVFEVFSRSIVRFVTIEMWSWLP